jgi:intracellular septation protein
MTNDTPKPQSAGTTVRRELGGWQKFAVDFVPLIVFLIAYNRSDMFTATALFMGATAIAVAASYILVRHVPPMLLFSAALVGLFGGLTLWLQDEAFIKMKPTFVFLLFAAILGFGLITGRNYLKSLLGAAFIGLSDRGWHLLALRWALFFLLLAGLNEIFWRFFSTDIWLHFKVWGDTLLTFGFALAQLPMLKKHGLKLSDG